MTPDDAEILSEVRDRLESGTMVPYLGPGVLELVGDTCPVPRSPADVVRCLIQKAAIPGRIRHDLSASAQYIESHQHRVTLERILADAFRSPPPPTPLHLWLAGLERLPMVVDLWYDGLMAAALAERSDWGLALGVSHPQTVGTWTRWFDHTGAEVGEAGGAGWRTIVYKPIGAAWPAGNWVISDSDFVETLTEIDIQSPIPDAVKARRSSCGFVFLGCRFDGELGRTFARQITKRSAGPLVAILPEEPTRNEARFLETLGIRRVVVPLAEAVTGFQRGSP